jgi:hypothetical protein
MNLHNYNMLKTLDTIDADPLLDCYYSLEKDISWVVSNWSRQTGVQHRPGIVSQTEPCESLKDGRSEWDYNIVHDLYKNTIIEELVKKYNLFRTRLMWVEPKSCYTLHKDHSTRIHIPLITNPNALFVFRKGFMFNLEVGKIYWTDTRLEHTFANFSEQARLHLVGCIK